MQRNPWLPYRKPSASARLRLFCFHFAGGSAAAFSSWRDHLPAAIDLCAVQLPGREHRFGDPTIDRMPRLVEAVRSGLRAELSEGPFAIFGHSMGAKLAFELARALAAESAPLPVHLFVSGTRGPTVLRRTDETDMYDLSDADFAARLREYGATSEEVLGNEELMSLLLPTLRADFAVSETYRFHGEPKVQVPLSALGGLQDPFVTREELEAWEQHAGAGFSKHFFPGEHFFLVDDPRPVVQVVLSQLRAYL